MISLNLSPETKVGTITSKNDDGITIRHVNGQTFTLKPDAFTKFVRDEKIAVSKAKVLFTQSRKGIVPEIVDRLYQQRVEIKKELKQHKLKQLKQSKSSKEYKQTKRIIDRLDIKQFTISR